MLNYAIEAAIFKLPIPFFNFTHNFWILKDLSKNKIIAQLHGLAMSRTTGRIVPIGYRHDHSLRAYCFVYDKNVARQLRLTVSSFALPIHDCNTIYTKEDSLERWLKALAALEAINNLNLDYPRGGFCIPLSKTINSNSVYHTFGQVMDIEVYRFTGFLQIGLQTSVYEQIKRSFNF
ncbi:Uncharacterised protein [Legionella busanensis]|uniref:Uncharacterized protein n=1 Tax=Legionella busanensis TaxID=190655 RepID=A0A378JIP9_9GAMM|nr:hypothetical protein [Legionella busanensis]STX50203.1 Uncharacterised protein [Legionella busanensis]